MKQFLSFLALVVALVVCAGSAFAQANLGQNFAGVQNIRFTRSAPTVAPGAMTYQDTVTIVNAADSVRTSNINTDLWDWSSVNVNFTGASRAVAQVVLWSPSALTNGLAVADTLCFAVEPSFDGGQSYVSNVYIKIAAVGAYALGNLLISCAPVTGFIDAASGGGLYYRGFIMANPGLAPIIGTTANYNVWGLRDFRLKLFGDVGAAGPVYGKIYPISPRAIR